MAPSPLDAEPPPAPLRGAVGAANRRVARERSARTEDTIDPLDIGRRAGRPLSRWVEQDWTERLSTLQVLASHGDPDAQDVIDQWLAHDPEARERAEAVERRCHEVRGADDAG